MIGLGLDGLGFLVVRKSKSCGNFLEISGNIRKNPCMHVIGIFLKIIQQVSVFVGQWMQIAFPYLKNVFFNLFSRPALFIGEETFQKTRHSQLSIVGCLPPEPFYGTYNKFSRHSI